METPFTVYRSLFTLYQTIASGFSNIPFKVFKNCAPVAPSITQADDAVAPTTSSLGELELPASHTRSVTIIGMA